MMEQGLSFHFKDGKHIKPTSCSVIGDIYKVWWRPILSLSSWLHCARGSTQPCQGPPCPAYCTANCLTIPYLQITFHTTPHYARGFLTMRYHTLPYNTIPYHSIPYHTIPYPSIPYHSIPYNTVPYHTIPYHTVPYHTIPYRTIPYQTLPSNTT